MAMLEIENLSFAYEKSDADALENISLEIERGQFVLLCGESGCGKTTLLRLIKRALAPAGRRRGKILFDGTDVSDADDRSSACDIGFVMQDPDAQIVCDKVWHELAFGLENIGSDQNEISRRIAEVCGFFGISDWYRRDTDTLSGGQKQLLCLASVMAMRPKMILLDEPTARLDPIAAADFVNMLRKINEELGIAVLITEHRLDELFPVADKVIVMDRARIFAQGTPREISLELGGDPNRKMNYALPSCVKIFSMLGGVGECPLTVREGKRFLENNYRNEYRGYDVENEDYRAREKAVEISGAYFRYERDMPDVLNGPDLCVYRKEIFCILGGNGSGKTTLLKVISGLKKPYRGKVEINGKSPKEYDGNSLYKNNIALLPQDPRPMFVKNELRADLIQTAKLAGADDGQAEIKVAEIAEKFGLTPLLSLNPFDLSGGEIQKAAFAKLLLTDPEIILADEPTKGLDAYSKKELGELLLGLKARGKTVIAVTHDAEFAAEYSDRCAMFFDGKIVSSDNPVNFFSSNAYYTTAASRISRGIYGNAVTTEMVVELARKNGIKERGL